jgi:hypothetical protein
MNGAFKFLNSYKYFHILLIKKKKKKKIPYIPMCIMSLFKCFRFHSEFVLEASDLLMA